MRKAHEFKFVPKALHSFADRQNIACAAHIAAARQYRVALMRNISRRFQRHIGMFGFQNCDEFETIKAVSGRAGLARRAKRRFLHKGACVGVSAVEIFVKTRRKDTEMTKAYLLYVEELRCPTTKYWQKFTRRVYKTRTGK